MTASPEFFIDDNGFKAGRVQIPNGHPIVAKIVKDSITDGGSRLVTWCWEYPRMIHAEILMHRALSRNSASSRAIPAAKLRQRTIIEPVIPIAWGANQKGMQAGDEIAEVDRAHSWWQRGLALMAEHHREGEALGLHKQIVNRVIEPWMTIAVVVSATDHANLFHLRKHPAAEPHFQALAGLAWELFHTNMPSYVPPGGWHLPYVDTLQVDAGPIKTISNESPRLWLSQMQAISVGRCARVSYLTHEGKRDPAEDIRLHDSLAQTASAGDPMHASPFEHQALAVGGRTRHANFEGWQQYRAFFPCENGPDTSKRCQHCGCWGGRHPLECPTAKAALGEAP